MGDEPTKKYILPDDQSGHPEARVDDVVLTRGSTEPVDLTEDQVQRLNAALDATDGGKGPEEVGDENDSKEDVELNARLKSTETLSGEALNTALRNQGLEVKGREHEKRQALQDKIRADAAE